MRSVDQVQSLYSPRAGIKADEVIEVEVVVAECLPSEDIFSESAHIWNAVHLVVPEADTLDSAMIPTVSEFFPLQKKSLYEDARDKLFLEENRRGVRAWHRLYLPHKMSVCFLIGVKTSIQVNLVPTTRNGVTELRCHLRRFDSSFLGAATPTPDSKLEIRAR